MLKVAQSMSDLWPLLTDEQGLLLTDSMFVRKYPKGSIIYHENDTPVYLYYLLKGKVKIYKEGVGGRPQIVHMPPLKGFFGYRAGLAGSDYILECAVLEECTLCHIPLSIVKRLIRENHQVAILFIRELSRLLGDAAEQTVSLTQKHLRGRLAECLLNLKDKYGTEENEKTLAITASREDLANLSNMTTSNAIRTLSSFANEGLVALDGRRISILDERQLQQIATLG